MKRARSWMLKRLAPALVVWSLGCAAPASPPPRTPGPLHLGWPVWIGVVCDDLEGQRRFYRDVMGLKETNVGVGWIWFDLDGKLLELFARSERPQYAQRGVAFGYLVDDIEAARAALIQRGARPVGGIESDGPDAWAYFADGEGNLFELVQKRGARDAPAPAAK